MLGTVTPRLFSQGTFLSAPSEASSKWLVGDEAELVPRQLRVAADGIEVLSETGASTGTDNDLLHSWRALVWSGSPTGKSGTLVLAFLVASADVDAGESSSDAPPASVECHAFEVVDKFKLLEVRSLVEMLRAHDLAVQSGLAPQRPTPQQQQQQQQQQQRHLQLQQQQQQQQVQLREKEGGTRGTSGKTKKKKRRSVLGWRRKSSTATLDEYEGASRAVGSSNTADGDGNDRVQRRSKKKGTKASSSSGGGGGGRRTSVFDMFSKLRFHKAKGSADLTTNFPMGEMSARGGGGGGGGADADDAAQAAAVMSAKPLSVQRRAVAASSIVARRVTSNDLGSSVIAAGYGTGRLAYYGPHKAGKDGLRCGVILDQPTGKNNGTVGEQFYFECPDKHGILVQASKVTVVQASATAPGVYAADNGGAADGSSSCGGGDTGAAGLGDALLGRKSSAKTSSAERNAEMLRLMNSGGEDGSGTFTAKQVGRFIKLVQENARTKSKEGWKSKIVAAARDERNKAMARAKEHVDRIRALKKGLPAPTTSRAAAAAAAAAADDASGEASAVAGSDPSAFMNRGVFGTDDEEREAAYQAMRSGGTLTEQQMKIVVATAEDEVTRELQPELDKLMHAARMQARAQAQQELVQKMSRKRTGRKQSHTKAANSGGGGVGGGGVKSSSGIVTQKPGAGVAAGSAVKEAGAGAGADVVVVRRRPKKSKVPAPAAANADNRQSYAETDL